jgi:hypothetical protein
MVTPPFRQLFLESTVLHTYPTMKKLLFVFLFFASAQTVWAQGPPTVAEQQALDKMTFAIKTIFNKLNSTDWVLRDDYFTNNMMLSGQQQGAPFGVNTNYGRVYNIKEGSATYQKVIQPLLDQKKAFLTAQKFDSARVVDNKISALSRFEVHANINQAQVGMGQNGKNVTYQALSLKGCTYASVVGSNNPSWTGRPHYHLLIGNWDVAQCSSATHNVSFKFKHPVSTPFIENVDIEIIGQCDFIDHFVKNSDWGILAGALTYNRLASLSFKPIADLSHLLPLLPF